MKQRIMTIEGDSVVCKTIEKTESCSLQQFIKDNTKNTVINYETPLLPDNLLKMKVTKDNNTYFVLIPKGIYELTYTRTKHKIPLPDQLFVFRINNNTGALEKQTYLWSYGKDSEDLDKANWIIPLIGNVFSGGNICTGGISTGKNPRETINKFITMFFERPFNDHLEKTRDFALPKIEKLSNEAYEKGVKEEDLAEVWTILVKETTSLRQGLNEHNGDLEPRKASRFY